MSDNIAFLLVFSIGLSVSLILVPVADWLGHRFHITTKPGGRRINEGDLRRVSKLGGIAIFGGFVVAVIAAQFLPVPRQDPYEIIRLIGLLAGGLVIFIVGLLDDIFEFSAIPQFIGQFVAAGVAIAFQIFIEYFNNPLTGQQTERFPYLITVAISLFWLIFVMNTMNWLDGLDGLSGGVTFIAGAMLFINSAFRVEPAQISVSLLPLALMGATLGFTLHNFYPARIFMGGGAQFLGYTLGALSIIGGAKMATILLVLGLPLIDVVWQAVNRLLHGRIPFSGDRGHLHFRLQDIGLSQRQIVIGYYLFCLAFGALTLITSSQLFKFIALGVLLFIVAAALFILTRHMRRTA
ncbi:MAG: UDP-N-acetylglucosamine--undecaprenyl-phosphate N-acetylglucosamine-1-phosphate transferase [Chloroflexi bacterium OLB15]|nr:MAG: UDP-N-acetylglucosamine--undecaprenyl-phosphate N-acetylglucosamine-1-phosphate transferase [Chloroflexi bacterium OLB15]